MKVNYFTDTYLLELNKITNTNRNLVQYDKTLKRNIKYLPRLSYV